MEYAAVIAGKVLVILILYFIRNGAKAEIREALKEAENEALQEDLRDIEQDNAEQYKIEVEERAGYQSKDTRSAADRLNDALSGLRKDRNRPNKA